MRRESERESLTAFVEELQVNGLDISMTELCLWLRLHGYLVAERGERFNLPSTLCIEQGLMAEMRMCYHHDNGSTSITVTPLLTTKGRDYFLKRIARYMQTRKEGV